MSKSAVLAVLFLLSQPLFALTPTRFVNGTDGACDGNSPCHASIQDAVDAAVDGEVIEVQTSSDYQENVVVDTKNDLTIQNRPGDAPNIAPLTGIGLELRVTSNFTLDGVDLDLHGASGAADGLVLAAGSEPHDGLVVKNLKIRGTTDGVDFDASIDGVTIDNVEILNATNDMGLEINAAAFGGTIQNVSITNCRFTASIRHLSLSGDVRDVVIDNNFFDRTLSGEAIVIENLAATAGPIDITNNVIIDRQQQGLLVRSGTNSGINVIGNTIVNPSTFNGNVDDNVGVTFRDSGSDNVIRDNIVVSNGSAAGYAKSGAQSVTFDHNLQSNVGVGTESGSESPIPLDATSIEANPVFIDDSSLADDYRLGCASPAIGASSTGANMGAEQSTSPAACAPCDSGGQVGDSDLDGVDSCIDECPSTPADTCVDAVGCRLRSTLFDFGAPWNYDDTGTDVSGTFKTTPLSSSGPAQLGFGESDQATTLTNHGNAAYYFNQEFMLGAPATIGSLALDLAYDDGYIVYVNGAEVGRSDNMAGVTDDFNSLAVFSAENWLDRGIVISPSVLVAGTNLIAVEIHQETTTSSDISLDARLQESPFCMSLVDADGDFFPEGSDCDDNDANNYPSNAEVCDGQDNDCNGLSDDGFGDLDDDGFGDECDCDPEDPLNLPPSEAGNSVTVDKIGTDALLAWDDEGQPENFRVYRGFRSLGVSFEYNHTCMTPPLATPAATDPIVPLSGRVFYYLVSRDECGESGLGTDSAGSQRPNDDPCNSTGFDADGDGVEESQDNCPGIPNPLQEDADDDAHGDVCDNCPGDSNPLQEDLDSDTLGDACDPDIDGDGFANPSDNCPLVPNDQADSDTDGVGDVCDNCPDDSNPDQEDTDVDNIGNACDLDPDNDGVEDPTDNCPLDENPGQENFDGDALGDACDLCIADPDNDLDSDGVCGDVDNCPSDANAAQDDSDSDDLGDVCDPCPSNPSLACVACPPGTDPDGDGVCSTQTVLLEEGTAIGYLANTTDPGVGMGWVAPGFPVGGWSTGTYGVGYEAGTGAENLISTPVSIGSASVYTRVVIGLGDPSGFNRLDLGADHDDGYAVWVNGFEVYRSPQMPLGPLDWDSLPSGHESSNGVDPDYGLPIDLSAVGLGLLAPGGNVVAIGVWNNSPASSDLVLVPRLSVSEGDNCPETSNPDQADADSDGFGDACESP